MATAFLRGSELSKVECRGQNATLVLNLGCLNKIHVNLLPNNQEVLSLPPSGEQQGN